MDNSRTHIRAKELVIKEVDKLLDKGSLTPQELHSLYEAYETIEHICKVMKSEQEEMGGYSERGYSMRWGSPYDDRYYNIHSYGNNGGSYSNTEASPKNEMVRSLYSMMGMATNETDRGALQDCINRIKTV